MKKLLKMFAVSVFMMGIACLSSVASADSIGGVSIYQNIYDVENMYGYPDKELTNSQSRNLIGEDFQNLKHYYYNNGMLVHMDTSDNSVKAVSIISRNRKLDNSGLTIGASDASWLIYSKPGYSSEASAYSGISGRNSIYVFTDSSDVSYVHVWMVGELSKNTAPYAKAITVSNLQHPQTGYTEYYGVW